MAKFCSKCGHSIEENAVFCPSCGTKIADDGQLAAQPNGTPAAIEPQPAPMTAPTAVPNQNGYINQFPGQGYVSGIDPSWPVKSKVAAGIFGIFLGGFGVHKFYMGKTGMGILYLLFFWTCIPMVAGFIEGVMYLCSSDENFQLNHHVRIG